MILYVLRHGEAVERSEQQADEWRYLTEKGRKSVASAAKAVTKLGRKPRLIVTSPLPRAVQTAEIAAGYACRKNKVEASPLLLPDAELSGVTAFISKHNAAANRVMLVGHEPLLGALVASLLGQSAGFALKKGACVALKLGKSGKPAEFLWYLIPGKKPVYSFKKALRTT